MPKPPPDPLPFEGPEFRSKVGTTLRMPAFLKQALDRVAAERGISFGMLCTEFLIRGYNEWQRANTPGQVK